MKSFLVWFAVSTTQKLSYLIFLIYPHLDIEGEAGAEEACVVLEVGVNDDK